MQVGYLTLLYAGGILNSPIHRLNLLLVFKIKKSKTKLFSAEKEMLQTTKEREIPKPLVMG